MASQKQDPARRMEASAGSKILKSGGQQQRFNGQRSKIGLSLQLSTQPQQSRRDVALAFARAGWPLHPVCDRTKRPLTLHGHKDATTDEVVIREWWQRWPNALVSIPTGPTTGLWVLDVDGPTGCHSLADLLTLLGCGDVSDLSPVVVETPSGGLHIYFKLRDSEPVRSRASDIGPGLDTRGAGGAIIAPGNVRSDGRDYRHIGTSDNLADAPHAPKELVYLATFNARERALISDDVGLSASIADAEPGAWREIFDEHQKRRRDATLARIADQPHDASGMRRQALADLAEEVGIFAGLVDGRRNALFVSVCRVARYVAHQVLTESEVCSAFEAAAAANGLTPKTGNGWIIATVRRGLRYGSNDPLPPLARQFRESAA